MMGAQVFGWYTLDNRVYFKENGLRFQEELSFELTEIIITRDGQLLVDGSAKLFGEIYLAGIQKENY